MNVEPERLSYLADLLTVVVLGGILLYAAGLLAEGKLGPALRSLGGGAR